METNFENITNCPLRPNHCSIDSPRCGRGKELAEKLKSGEPIDLDALRKEHDHGEHGHGGHGPRDRESLEGLLCECGHVLHHGNKSGKELFAALSAAEEETMKGLLRKLVESWNGG